MSHTVKIKTSFKDWATLKRALESFGWTVRENSTMRTYGYGTDSTKVYPFVAVNPQKGYNAYDMGIEVNGEDIKLYGDFFGGSIASQLGEDLSKLKQEYAFKTIEDEFLYQGASVTKTVNANGSWTVEVEQQ